MWTDRHGQHHRHARVAHLSEVPTVTICTEPGPRDSWAVARPARLGDAAVARVACTAKCMPVPTVVRLVLVPLFHCVVAERITTLNGAPGSGL
jgi:hypothetical protein